MTRKRHFRLAIGLLGFLVAVLALTVPASAEWKEKVLYSFQGGTDGSTPAGGVVFDKQGNLYGATTDGGSSSCRGPFQCGTVYQLRPPDRKGDPWTETVLYVFKGSDFNDGASPFGGLVWDQAGNLYGTTGYDGSGNCMLFGSRVGCGTVYQLKPPRVPGGAWTETVIYNFQGGNDGQLPVGDLVFDKEGNLYGATYYGGGFGSCNSPYDQYCGTVFKLSPPRTKGGRKWKEKVLYEFKSGKDGANPNGGLVFDSKGAIYGTTYAGGNQDCKSDSSVGCGTAFKLKLPASTVWKETVFHRFSADEGNPSAGMTFDGMGYLYGTTVGLIFRFAPPSTKSGRWREMILYTFNQEAYGPEGALVFDKNRNAYGTTYSGNTFSGTVFRLKPPAREDGGWTFSILYGFSGTSDGAKPAAGLIFDKQGNMYSTTQLGGTGACAFGCGTVFEVSP